MGEWAGDLIVVSVLLPLPSPDLDFGRYSWSLSRPDSSAPTFSKIIILELDQGWGLGRDNDHEYGPGSRSGLGGQLR